MSVKSHYDKHLANFYSWMAGDFESKQKEFGQFLRENNIAPQSTKLAVDLGAGHGIQSVALAHAGFEVKAIDFNEQLRNELSRNSKGLSIESINEDIRGINKYKELNPELILCCGDTLTHLDSKEDIKQFLEDCISALVDNGKLILSFRDYTNELKGDERLIPVKSDDERILTCFLEYFPEYVRVTDLLYEKAGESWQQKVSSYSKVRIPPEEVVQVLNTNGMQIVFDKPVNRQVTIIAVKTHKA